MGKYTNPCHIRRWRGTAHPITPIMMVRALHYVPLLSCKAFGIPSSHIKSLSVLKGPVRFDFLTKPLSYGLLLYTEFHAKSTTAEIFIDQYIQQISYDYG